MTMTTPERSDLFWDLIHWIDSHLDDDPPPPPASDHYTAYLQDLLRRIEDHYDTDEDE